MSFNAQCCCLVTKLCPTLLTHGLQHARLPCPSLSPERKKKKVQSLSRVQLFTTALLQPTQLLHPWECWSGLPFPSSGDLTDPGNETRSPALQADALPSEPPGEIPTIPWGQLKFMSVEIGCNLTFSSAAVPFSFCLQSFPASGYFLQ